MIDQECFDEWYDENPDCGTEEDFDVYDLLPKHQSRMGVRNVKRYVLRSKIRTSGRDNIRQE